MNVSEKLDEPQGVHPTPIGGSSSIPYVQGRWVAGVVPGAFLPRMERNAVGSQRLAPLR
jgi:hypothetical protein